MDRPLVSIVIPSFNQGRFIGQTLDSVLSQSYRPLEVVVMDGASTDETVEVLRRYAAKYPELKWISEKDSGCAEAVNKGLALARGEIVAIQSSDDIYLPGAAESAAAFLIRNPDVGLVYGDSAAMDENGKEYWTSRWEPFTLENYLCRRTRIPQASAFFRMDLVRQVGGWSPKYFIADAELWQRMIFRTRIVKLDELWSCWRRHGEQRDKQKRRMWESYWAMIRDDQDLKRAPLKLRLAAWSGAHSFALPHGDFMSEWRRAAHLWLALLLYPPSWPVIYDKRALVPGLSRLIDRLKR